MINVVFVVKKCLLLVFSCGHVLCASCFACHMRENNNCPYCQKKFVKPKK